MSNEQLNQQADDVNAAEAPVEEKKEKKEKKPRLTAMEKFLKDTTEEERIQTAKKIAELRIDPNAERTMSWKNIREHEDVILTSDQFHKLIRPEEYYQEAVLERLSDLIEDGWVYTGSLTTLCGFEVPSDISDAMEKNIEDQKAKVKAEADAKKAKAEEEKKAKAKEVEEAKAKESQEKDNKGKQSPPTTKAKSGK